jgi:uncharacterized ion transporter superfamily protein YfcC
MSDLSAGEIVGIVLGLILFVILLIWYAKSKEKRDTANVKKFNEDQENSRRADEVRKEQNEEFLNRHRGETSIFTT